MERASELNRALAPARNSGWLLCAFSAVQSVAAVGLAYASYGLTGRTTSGAAMLSLVDCNGRD